MMNIEYPVTGTCQGCQIDVPADTLVGRSDQTGARIEVCPSCARTADVSPLPDDWPDTTPRPQIPDFEPLTAQLRDAAVEAALRAVNTRWERLRLGVHVKWVRVGDRVLVVRIQLGLSRADVYDPVASATGLRVELRCTDRQLVRLLGLA